MKLVSSRYLLVTLPAGQSTHRLTLPVGLVRCTESHQKLKIYAKKIVLRNAFPVFSAATNSLLVNGAAVTLRTGSPAATLLADELTKKIPTSRWSFDTYDGTLYVQNIGGAALQLQPGTCGPLLGLTGPLTVPPGSGSYLPTAVNLSPPDIVLFRSDLVIETLELTPSQCSTSDVLSFVGMDVPPYATKVFHDETGMYGHFLKRNELQTLTLRLTDQGSTPLVSPLPILLVLACEVWQDDEGALLSLTREQLDLSKLRLLQGEMQTQK
jgi:hypothetical protein